MPCISDKAQLEGSKSSTHYLSDKVLLTTYPPPTLATPVWKVCIARPRYRARNFDALIYLLVNFANLGRISGAQFSNFPVRWPRIKAQLPDYIQTSKSRYLRPQ